MFAKENQPTLRTDIAALFERVREATRHLERHRNPQNVIQTQRVQSCGDGIQGLELHRADSQEVGHGRIERRVLEALTLHDGLDWLDWPGARQIFRLERQTRFKRSGKTRGEVVYGLTSLPPSLADASALLALCRGHWSIENRCHWVRDVTFDEDRSSVRTGSIPQVMAALRNTAIGLLRLNGHSNIAAACRSHAYNPRKLLPLILSPPTFK